jgi:hypothetical protein
MTLTETFAQQLNCHINQSTKKEGINAFFFCAYPNVNVRGRRKSLNALSNPSISVSFVVLFTINTPRSAVLSRV